MDIAEFEHIAKMAIGGCLTVYFGAEVIHIGRERDASYFMIEGESTSEEKHPRHVITTVARTQDYVLVATGKQIVHIDPIGVQAVTITGLPDVATVLGEARERAPGLYL